MIRKNIQPWNFLFARVFGLEAASAGVPDPNHLLVSPQSATEVHE
jgi:hypothetical protein